jgi:hypothetical protein
MLDSDRRLAQNDKIPIDTLQPMQNTVGAIAAPIVEENKLAKVLNVIANKRFDDIQSILYARNNHQFHLFANL